MAERLDWQPARFAYPPHHALVQPGASEADIRKVMKYHIRVRPANPSADTIAKYRAAGCLAERFFEMETDDLSTPILCEHELLTD